MLLDFSFIALKVHKLLPCSYNIALYVYELFYFTPIIEISSS